MVIDGFPFDVVARMCFLRIALVFYKLKTELLKCRAWIMWGVSFYLFKKNSILHDESYFISIDILVLKPWKFDATAFYVWFIFLCTEWPATPCARDFNHELDHTHLVDQNKQQRGLHWKTPTACPFKPDKIYRVEDLQLRSQDLQPSLSVWSLVLSSWKLWWFDLKHWKLPDFKLQVLSRCSWLPPSISLSILPPWTWLVRGVDSLMPGPACLLILC